MGFAHLQLVNGVYRVRVVVPVALRDVIGQGSLVKGLGTPNYGQAARLAGPYIAAFKSKIASAIRVHNSMGLQYHNNVKSTRHPNLTDAASHSREWYTPPRVFDAMGVEFDLDPASPGADVVPWIPSRKHLTITDDGLAAAWSGFVWLNPPYGIRYGMQKWIDRFVAHRNGIILLPGYTYTKWFHNFIVETDCHLFPLNKFQFISPLSPNGSNSTMANFLAAIGEMGVAALRTAAANGLGKLACTVFFRRGDTAQKSAHPRIAVPKIDKLVGSGTE